MVAIGGQHGFAVRLRARGPCGGRSLGWTAALAGPSTWWHSLLPRLSLLVSCCLRKQQV